MEGVVGGVIGGVATGGAVAWTLRFERRHAEKVELRAEVAALHTLASEWQLRTSFTGVSEPDYSVSPDVARAIREALAPVMAKADLVAVRIKALGSGRSGPNLAEQLDKLQSRLRLWQHEPTPVIELVRAVVDLSLWCDAWLAGDQTATEATGVYHGDKQIFGDSDETSPTAAS